MEIFTNIINRINHIFSVLGKVVSIILVLLCLLMVSIFTPLFSKAILWLLNQTNLPIHAHSDTEPTAIVTLGGGLINDEKNDIIIAQSTKERLLTTKEIYLQYKTPIVVSGKDAPWMMQWLNQQDIFWVIPEKHSHNTCENARFTAKTLPLEHVFLVTDPYHMRRARRQFALNGIATTPVIAPLQQSTSWVYYQHNIRHSRRALYEIGALARDLFRPQSNCRNDNHLNKT